MLVIKCAKFKKLDKSKNVDKVIENRKNVNKILDLLKNNNFVNNLYGIRFYRITIDSSSFTEQRIERLQPNHQIVML